MAHPPCLRLCPAYPGNPRNRIEGESPHQEKGHTVFAPSGLRCYVDAPSLETIGTRVVQGHLTHPFLRFLARTPVHTFVLMPMVVAACELIWRGGTLAFDPWGVPLLVLGYAQYRLVGRFRSQHGGGGPGVDVPPTRLVTEGPF